MNELARSPAPANSSPGAAGTQNGTHGRPQTAYRSTSRIEIICVLVAHTASGFTSLVTVQLHGVPLPWYRAFPVTGSRLDPTISEQMDWP